MRGNGGEVGNMAENGCVWPVRSGAMTDIGAGGGGGGFRGIASILGKGLAASTPRPAKLLPI